MNTNAPAMLLAAGRGQRMRPLTDVTPKPLLPVHGKPLMQWMLEALRRGGCTQVVVNTAWLGRQISDAFGQPPVQSQLEGLRIAYSHEGLDFGRALETAGGIARALPLLGEVFWLCAGDIYAPQFEFSNAAVARFRASGKLAHIWLVPNPAQHPKGDFALDSNGLLHNQANAQAPQRRTYSTIGLYRDAFFASLPAGNPEGLVVPLVPLMRQAIDNGQMSGELFLGEWADVGIPERLAQINSAAMPTYSTPSNNLSQA